MLSNILSIPVFAEEASTYVTEEAYEVVLSPENYATVLLNTAATNHNSKDNISTATQYAYVNHSTISKAMRAYTFVTEFYIPLKSAVNSMLYNGTLYREGNKDSTVNIRYVNSQIKTDSTDTMPTLVSGIYQASYEKTVDTGETDTDGNAITTTQTVVSETDAEYQNWYNYAKQFWTSTLPTAGSVNQSCAFSLDFTDTAMAALGESDYLTFGTSRVGHYSRYFYQSVPTLTLTYNASDIIAYANSINSGNVEEVLNNLGKLGVLDSDAAAYNDYAILDGEFKPLVNSSMTKATGFTTLDDISSAFASAMDLDNIMLNYLNSATEDNIAVVMEKLGASGKFDESTSSYDAYKTLSEAAKEEVNAKMLALIPEDGFSSFTDACAAFDSAMVLDTLDVTISPQNYATVLLSTSATYHNSKDNISTATQYAYVNSDTISKAMRAYTFVTEFKIPFKSYLSAVAYNGNLYREGNKKSTLSIKYVNSQIKTDSEDTMPTLVSGRYQGSYEKTVDTGETDADGNAITTTETVVSETDAEYKNWYNYAKQFWSSALPTAGSINQSGAFSIDVTETAMNALKSGNSDYLTFGTTRVKDNASRYYYKTIPTLTLTYVQADVFEYLKKATSENIDEILEELGNAGLLKNIFARYLLLDDAHKAFVKNKIVTSLENGEYKTYSEFLNSYEESTNKPLKTTLYELEITDAQNGTKYSDLSAAAGKNVIIKLPVWFVDESSDDISLILAAYDASGILLNIKTKSISSAQKYAEFEMTLPQDIFSIKSMCWNSLGGITPLCEKSILAENMDTLNLMTFNIRTIAGSDTGVKDWDNRKAAVVEFINESDAAVICMQEVKTEQYEYISENISEPYEILHFPCGTGGTAIAYDKEIFELIEQNIFWLSATPDVESIGWDAAYIRACPNILFKHKEKGGMFKVFNVHLDNKGETAREKGLEVVMERVNRTDYPTFVAGDFNLKRTADCYPIIANAMQDCQKTALVTDDGVTYNGWGKNTDYANIPIDFCFVSKENMRPLTFEICRDRWNETNYYSDHYAVKTTVKVTFEK